MGACSDEICLFSPWKMEDRKKKKKNTIRLVLLPPHPNRKLLQENEEGNGDGDTVVVFLQRLMS